jgi:hypothetical protein
LVAVLTPMRSIAAGLGLMLAMASPSSFAAQGDCAQPVSGGGQPVATDCLFILGVAVGSRVCSPACVCAPKGALPATATDALLCLRRATGQPAALNCPSPCGGPAAPPFVLGVGLSGLEGLYDGARAWGPFREGGVEAYLTAGGTDGSQAIRPVSAIDGPGIDPATVLVDFSGETQPVFHALTLVNDSGNERDVWLQIGPAGFALRSWRPEQSAFDPSIELDPDAHSWTDAQPYGNDLAAGGAIVTDNTAGAVASFDLVEATGLFAGPTLRVSSSSIAAAVSGTAVSAYAQSPTGAILGVADDATPGAASKLFLHDGGASDRPVDVVGDLGQRARRIRCALPVCVVSNFVDATLSIVTWDGGLTAGIVGTVTVGEGPIGVDLVATGQRFAAISTGFADQSYTVTLIDAAGQVVDSTTSAVPAGCSGPAHALWLRDDAGTAVLSCNGSSTIAVIPGALP